MRSSSGWLLRLLALVVAFGVVTLWRSHAVGIGVRDPGGQYLVGKVLISVGVFAALVVVDAFVRTPRRDWRAGSLVATVRERWTWQRLGVAWAALLCYHLVYFCYHNLKSWDVFNAPRDAMLTDVDRWLFLGHSPAVLLHDLLGQGAAAWVLIVVYESFPTLVTVSFVAAVVLTERIRDGAVFIAAMCWAWVLGTASYYAIPSLGPFHDRPQDFAGLPASIVTRTQAEYMAQRAHLLADPGAHDAFAQISAFASLHVAITTVIVLMTAYYGMRRTTIALSIYLAGTLVATVYLGWHFVVDDVAGLAIGGAAVALGRLTIGRARSEPPAGPALPSDRPFTVVSFHAHPDDEALLTSGTLARAAADGHRVVIVVATAGEAGLARDEWSGESLGDRRMRELAESARAIGAARVEVLGYRDSGWQPTTSTTADPSESFCQVSADEVARDLAALLVEEAADVLTIYDENGGYGHPDHVQVHRVGVRAAELAGTPIVLEATIDRDLIGRAVGLLRRLSRLVPVPELPDMSAAYTARADLTHRVDVRRQLPAKCASLRAHVSQSTGAGSGDVRTLALLLRLPRPLRRLALGHEWFRERGRTPNGLLIDDIFASSRSAS